MTTLSFSSHSACSQSITHITSESPLLLDLTFPLPKTFRQQRCNRIPHHRRPLDMPLEGGKTGRFPSSNERPEDLDQ